MLPSLRRHANDGRKQIRSHSCHETRRYKHQSVSLVEINNAANEYEVTYKYSDDRIYVPHEEFEKLNKDININFNVNYGESGRSLVYASYQVSMMYLK